MNRIIDIPNSTEPNEVILACMADHEVRLAVMSPYQRFNEVLRRIPEDEHTSWRAARYIGRQLLDESGLLAMAVGAERFVLHNPSTKQAIRYVYASENPREDIEVERRDWQICRDYIGSAVIATEIEVDELAGQEVLVERQPWLDIVPAMQVQRPNVAVDDQIESILLQAEAIYRDHGLFIDGSSLMASRDNNVVIVDTSLVAPDEIYTQEPATEPSSSVQQKRRRTWRGLGLSPA